ncbi:MAG: outer membrane lipid asymmetry maintenance protein MlaD [Pseudomonadales bacterium]|nr:outer membrane lipid asymmetry maintenance protein MlaD [Pseudomonadales bacterium]
MTMRWMEISVGAFMIAGMLALSTLALKVSGLQLSGPENHYYVTADFENIGALKIRSKVSLSGLVVGEVTKIEYVREDYTARVTLKIKSSYDNLPIDSIAVILTQGMLGDQYIGLSIGAEEEYLIDGSAMEETQSAIVLEELIGKFVTGMASG